MIITERKTNTVTSGIQGSVTFGIKEGGLAHIFNVLRNSLYSNKILAVLREYTINGVDSHVEAGCPERPIEVTLPSRLSLELKIRDFGLGLSESDIQDVYAFYGESTKRKSNSLIGQLGLGSKSAFAYGDNFVINSFVDGVKTTYNAYIDPSQIGQIAKLASCKTSEANGVEIVIPVKPVDCDNFVSTARELFKYFAIKPVVKGVAQFNYEKTEVLYSGDGWRLTSSENSYSHSSVAIMGNIAYKISPSSLKLSEDIEDEALIEKLLSNCNIELDVQIGDLDIAASREGLQYTDKTINSLKASILKMRDELSVNVSKALKGAQSLWSFKKMLGEMHDMSSPYYVVCNAMRGKKSWDYNGTPVKNFDVTFRNSRGFKLYTPKKGYVNGTYIVKSGQITSPLDHNITLNKQIIVVENTRKLKSQITNYLFSYLQQDKKVILCEFDNAAHRKSQMDDLGLSDCDIVDMSTLTKVMLPRSTSRRSLSGNATFAVRSKHTSKVFTIDPSASGLSSYHRVKSDYWQENDVEFDKLDPKTHCFIPIDRFIGKLPNGMEISPNSMLSTCKHLKDLIDNSKAKGMVVPTIIGIKGSQQLDKIRKTKVKEFSAFMIDSLKEVERQTNCGEILYATEIYNAFAKKNGSVLSDNLFKKITAVESPNLYRLMSEIKSLQPKGVQVHIQEAFLHVCDKVVVLSTSLRSKRSANLDAIESKANSVSHALRLLHSVDTYAFQTYRSGHKEAIEAALDYMKTRDHLLAGV